MLAFTGMLERELGTGIQIKATQGSLHTVPGSLHSAQRSVRQANEQLN